MTLRKPRKKISVMIVGNHSAGKSSFINWYIGESIQKTGVAIEVRTLHHRWLAGWIANLRQNAHTRPWRPAV